MHFKGSSRGKGRKLSRTDSWQTAHLVEGLWVSPVVTLLILENGGGTNLNGVAGEALSQGLHCILALLDWQQGQGSESEETKGQFKRQRIVRILIIGSRSNGSSGCCCCWVNIGCNSVNTI